MELESYFDFVSPEEIRIKGTRMGIEFVLRDYRAGASPEEIVLRYPTVSLEQVHATITYYLHHRGSVDAYMARWWGQGEAAWEEQQRHPSEFVRDLRDRVERQRRRIRSRARMRNLPAALYLDEDVSVIVDGIAPGR